MGDGRIGELRVTLYLRMNEFLRKALLYPSLYLKFQRRDIIIGCRRRVANMEIEKPG
jgi:hypothetical protein